MLALAANAPLFSFAFSPRGTRRKVRVKLNRRDLCCAEGEPDRNSFLFRSHVVDRNRQIQTLAPRIHACCLFLSLRLCHLFRPLARRRGRKVAKKLERAPWIFRGPRDSRESRAFFRTVGYSVRSPRETRLYECRDFRTIE